MYLLNHSFLTFPAQFWMPNSNSQYDSGFWTTEMYVDLDWDQMECVILGTGKIPIFLETAGNRNQQQQDRLNRKT